MKIRTDFVTNSSSVSFIVTMHKYVLEGLEKWYCGYKGEQKLILDAIRTRFKKEGTRVLIENEELYTIKIKFSTDDVISKESLKKGTNFSKLTEDELWSYIYGEYILEGEINKFQGIGAVMTETY